MKISTPLSGLMAASTMFDVTANNIANADTAGFSPSRVDLQAVAPDAGVEVAGITPDGSDVDLATEAVGLTIAKTLYAANARALRTEEDALGALFDERV